MTNGHLESPEEGSQIATSPADDVDELGNVCVRDLVSRLGVRGLLILGSVDNENMFVNVILNFKT